MKEQLIKMKVRKDMKINRMIEKMKYEQRGDFGIDAIIGIAIGMIVAAFILVPGFRALANQMVTDMQRWWDQTISQTIFPTK